MLTVSVKYSCPLIERSGARVDPDGETLPELRSDPAPGKGSDPTGTKGDDPELEKGAAEPWPKSEKGVGGVRSGCSIVTKTS